MNDNTPLNDTVSSDVLGENLKLLILHKTYLEITEDKEEKKEE